MNINYDDNESASLLNFIIISSDNITMNYAQI